jgi:hypothetical protein
MTTRPGEDTNTHITDAGNDNDSAASEDDDCETSEDDDSELSDDDVSEASEHFPANHLLVREGRRTNYQSFALSLLRLYIFADKYDVPQLHDHVITTFVM